eukprot:maker-scaffold234_size243041-snap-gene-1.27 protein:Tk10942 transcript:maker-scaffold234_size243041-snap-gene-1.27-mRNA-1 annotation:"hypothetical protein TcasGA2_TC003735"
MSDFNAADLDLSIQRYVYNKRSQEFEFLGVKFDTNFTTSPHDNNVARAARRRAGLVARLGHHLPRGEFLRRLAGGLIMGKVGYAAAVTVPPRLAGDNAPQSNAHKATQVAINDVARTITGKSRKEHLRIPDLLHLAKIPSVNELAIKAIVLETWKALHSSDGKNGSRNPIGQIIFPPTSSEDPSLSDTLGLRCDAILASLVQGRTIIGHGARGMLRIVAVPQAFSPIGTDPTAFLGSAHLPNALQSAKASAMDPAEDLGAFLLATDAVGSAFLLRQIQTAREREYGLDSLVNLFDVAQLMVVLIWLVASVQSQPQGLSYPPLQPTVYQPPGYGANVRHSALEANCRIEFEAIPVQECIPRVEVVCETEEVLMEEIAYNLKCQQIVEQACGQKTPTAPEFRHSCFDIVRDYCYPEASKTSVMKPVQKCFSIQKVCSLIATCLALAAAEPQQPYWPGILSAQAPKAAQGYQQGSFLARNTAPNNANCKVEIETISRNECRPLVETICETGAVLYEEISYEIKCKSIVEQICDGVNNPYVYQVAQSRQSSCQDVTNEFCYPEAIKHEVTRPVQKCWKTQKVDCYPVLENIPKRVCQVFEGDVANNRDALRQVQIIDE